MQLQIGGGLATDGVIGRATTSAAIAARPSVDVLKIGFSCDIGSHALKDWPPDNSKDRSEPRSTN
jgi:hypothetical protein